MPAAAFASTAIASLTATSLGAGNRDASGSVCVGVPRPMHVLVRPEPGVSGVRGVGSACSCRPAHAAPRIDACRDESAIIYNFLVAKASQ